MPSFPPLDAPLSDSGLALRLSAERDIPEVLIAYQDDARLAAALGERRPPTGAVLGSRAENAPELMASGRGLVFTIVQAGADHCLGEVRVSAVNWQTRRARLTVWVAPGARGRGFGAQACRLARDWLSERCGLTADCAGSD